MIRKESSDERLLKIIEGKSEPRGMPSVGMKTKGLKGSGPLRLRFSFGLPAVNGIMIGAGILATGFLLVAVSGNLFVRDADMFLTPVTRALSPKAVAGKSEPVAWQAYAAAFERRHIFFPAGKKPAEKQVVSEKTVNTEEIFRDFKLVGVIWSANPEVMIESAKEQRTVLLKKGETFGASNVRVKDITKSAAMLEVDAGGGNFEEYQLR
jgi:hypothetical protein